MRKDFSRFHGWTVSLLVLASAILTHAAAPADSKQARQLFTNPTRDYSTAPLWIWNDMITPQQIRDTLQDLAGQRVKQVFVHARSGLMTPYLSKDWFSLWKLALEEGKKLDMNVWIYDEDTYPSGFAGGLVPEAMPEARGRGLDLKESRTAPKWTNNILAVYRIDGEKSEIVTDQVKSGRALPDARYVVASIRRAGSSDRYANHPYVDLLYPGVTAKFLETTLEPYRKEFGKEFGVHIPGTFTDEPQIRPAGGLPWTDDLPKQFQLRWGYSLMDNLPSLSLQVGDWRKVRHNYYQTLSELFIERWAKPYYEYCRANNLEFTGHYWDHEWPNLTGVPDSMAMYAWHQRPAIDCLMNQYSDTGAQFGNIRMVRELSSVANQLGKKRTLCEIYGAGGWDLRFEDMKRIGDWLEVLGVNTLDEHLSYISIRGSRKRDHPQSFSYHEPWWEAYHVNEDYFTRVSAALSQGSQINRILVLEPTTTAWMYQGDSAKLKQIKDSFTKLLNNLEAAQWEYDLADEDILSREGSVIEKDTLPKLKVAKRAYYQVILPEDLENVNGTTAKLLQEFVESEGILSYLSLPTRVNGAPSDKLKAEIERRVALPPSTTPGSRTGKHLRKWNAADYAQKLKSYQLTDPTCVITRSEGDKGILLHNRRILNDGQILFLANSSLSSSSSGSIDSTLSSIEVWDPYTGETKPYAFTRNAQGVSAKFNLPPSGSLLLFLTPKTFQPAAIPNTTIAGLAPTTTEIRRLEPNVLTLDYVDIRAGGQDRTNLYFYQANQFAFKQNGLARNPWDNTVQFKDDLLKLKFPARSGFAASYWFNIEGIPPQNVVAVIERPDLYTIRCNGLPVTVKEGEWWIDKSFGKVDLSAALRTGANIITVRAEPFTIYHELESIYILGDFNLKPAASGFTISSAQPMQLGKWNEQGMPFYSEGVAYRQSYKVDKLEGEYRVALTNWYGSVAKVRVNGYAVGYITAPPWQCDVTKALKPGANTVEVEVIGTLKNTLGPHHGNPALGSAWPADFQKGPNPGPPAGNSYSTVGYGMFQPFTLEQVSLK
jgi:hypothetical protein